MTAYGKGSSEQDEGLLDTKIRRTYFLLSAGRKFKRCRHSWSECSSRASRDDSSVASDSSSTKHTEQSQYCTKCLLTSIAWILTVLLIVFTVMVVLHLHLPTYAKRRNPPRSKSRPGCEIGFGENLPLVPLVSFPGSGNTWLRHLIEETSGIYTGSVYDDHRLFHSGFQGEYEQPLSGKTLVIKTHYGNGIGDRGDWPQVQELFSQPNLKCVLLLRHPVDAFFSSRAFQTTHHHKGHYLYPDFHSMVERNLWKERVQTWADYYVKTYDDLQKNCTQGTKYVFYENLVDKPWHWAKKVVQFAAGEMQHSPRMNKSCVRNYGEGNFHRKHAPTEHILTFPEDLFDFHEQQALDLVMTRLNSTLRGRLPMQYSFYKK